jgi:hypothetical protein
MSKYRDFEISTAADRNIDDTARRWHQIKTAGIITKNFIASKIVLKKVGK